MMSSTINRHEVLALVCLARYVVCADGKISDAELRAMMQLARDIGLDVFSDALETTDDTRKLDRAELLELAGYVREQDKRVWMHQHLVELAGSDGLVSAEKTLLSDLAEVWEVEWAA
jgi:uncharacterized tellurite resistance protein B-like protein